MRKSIKTKPLAPTKPVLQLDPAKKQLLHVTGHLRQALALPRQFPDSQWQEIRLGSQNTAAPHIRASLGKMSAIAANQFHGVWLPSPTLEQLYAHEVMTGLREIHRILKEGGVLFMSVIDIQKVAEFIAKGNLEGKLYKTAEGVEMSALDTLYGPRQELAAGHLQASPNTAFTAQTLAAKLGEAGFDRIQVRRDGALLWAVCYKLHRTQGTPPQVEIIGEDLNKMMRYRDELDKAPEIWTAPSPLFP